VGVPVGILLQGEAPPEGLLASVVLIASGIALVTMGQVRSGHPNPDRRTPLESRE
jgi:hypothetical protein